MGLIIPPRVRFLKKHEKFSEQIKSDLSTKELINKLTGSAPKDSVAGKLSDSGNETTSKSESEDSGDSDINESESDESDDSEYSDKNELESGESKDSANSDINESESGESEDSENSDINESESEESEDSESETEELPGKPQLGSDRAVLERKTISNATSKSGKIDPESSSGDSEISEPDEREDIQEESENDRNKKNSNTFNFDFCDEDFDDILTIKKENTDKLEEHKNNAESSVKEVSRFYSTSAIYISR